MNQVFSIYMKAVRRDLFLLLAIMVISILTYPFWLGFPLFYSIITMPYFAPILFPFISSFLLSLGFLYTNINAAKELHNNSQRSIFHWTLYFQIRIFGIIFLFIFTGYMVILYLSQ
ncbi:hypothetical protein [Bacillus mesophilum]|uniref:hypothetical protein n=1 Tax=Bacillus mesophilum TaxID=1071718 RepID=UPI0013763FF1|nr:hypothetical protein [Bacillus mesophilum]